MNQMLITGRMSEATLERALYSDWTVKSYVGTEDGCVAVIEATVEGNSPDWQMGRMQSFGTVGVRLSPTEADIADAMERLTR